jgi:15-cis-phytoene synthase
VSAAAEITRRANSNLAFALKILPRDRREDMVIFYAFCRTMDDLADQTELPLEQRREQLNLWREGILVGFAAAGELQQQVLELRDRKQLPNELLVAIIDGCLMDLQHQRFATWDDLSAYIWKVACAVGLISVRLFGGKDPACENYAIALGHALQLTNIIRDVADDWNNGQRLYLPLEDLACFGYSEDNLAAQLYDERFLSLLDFQAQRAEGFYQQAAAALPTSDREVLLPAQIMGEVYQLLLQTMLRDRYQVFTKRYKISKSRKLLILTKHLIARSARSA